MRKILVLVLSIIIGISLHAQNRLNDNGEKIGHWEKKYSNGKLKYTGQFENGNEVGKFIYFFPNGSKKSVLVFSENGLRAGVTNYYTTGKILSKGAYYNKKKDGIWRFYNGEQKLVKQDSYSKGLKDGAWIVFYVSNGNRASEINWKGGVKNGSWKEFFENGQLKLSATYANDKLIGEHKSFYLNRRVSRKGKYINGKQDGPWIAYSESGVIVNKAVFDKGYLEKELRYENGKVVLIIDHKTGKTIDYTKKDGGKK